MKKVIVAIVALMVMVSLVFGRAVVMFSKTMDNTGAVLSVNPPEIINPDIPASQNIRVNVTVRNVTDMWRYDFNLSYNSDILICWGTPRCLDALGETHYVPQFKVDNTAGTVVVNVAYYSPAESITTLPEVALVAFEFRVKTTGATVLDLCDVNITDSAGQLILCEEQDGVFSNRHGDVNSDGKVDLTDLLLIIDAFWSDPSVPRWNENADSNVDGQVGLDDLLTLLEHFWS